MLCIKKVNIMGIFKKYELNKLSFCKSLNLLSIIVPNLLLLPINLFKVRNNIIFYFIFIIFIICIF